MKKLINIAVAAIGILAIILGIVVLTKSNGSSGDTATFGADFYTYVNRNAARIASNTQLIIEILKFGFGWLFILGGALTTAIGLSKIDSPAAKAPETEAADVQETKEESPKADEAPEQQKTTL